MLRVTILAIILAPVIAVNLVGWTSAVLQLAGYL